VRHPAGQLDASGVYRRLGSSSESIGFDIVEARVGEIETNDAGELASAKGTVTRWPAPANLVAGLGNGIGILGGAPGAWMERGRRLRNNSSQGSFLTKDAKTRKRKEITKSLRPGVLAPLR